MEVTEDGIFVITDYAVNQNQIFNRPPLSETLVCCDETTTGKHLLREITEL